MQSYYRSSDCKLATMGLVVDGAGFAKHSSIEATIVIDAEVATEENVQWLREQGYRYLVVKSEKKRLKEASMMGRESRQKPIDQQFQM